MKVIELERWEPKKEDPRYTQYAGPRIAEEVFKELRYRLESTGYLPDEYFTMDREWANGREIPRGADIFCTTDYGESEGVYLDVYLKWYDEKQEKNITKSFITGKTLGENGNDLDRMFLISSAITKAFHGDNTTHSRVMGINGQEDTGGAVFHLSAAEQQTFLTALIEQRERQEAAMTQTEQLLRRMTGSITAYIDTVCQRPLRMSDYDKAALAIRDGELKTLKELLPGLKEQTDGLLLETAGRPGEVGRKMTLLLLTEQDSFSLEGYRAACVKAIEMADVERVGFLLEQAQTHVKNLPLSFYGEMAKEAYWDYSHITFQIIKHSTPEQGAAFPSKLLRAAVMRNDVQTTILLAHNRINAGDCFPEIIWYCGQNKCEDIIERLLQQGLRFDPENYWALSACMNERLLNTGKLLLDKGMDFEKFRDWYGENVGDLAENEVYKELAAYWEQTHGQAQEEQADMGMNMT